MGALLSFCKEHCYTNRKNYLTYFLIFSCAEFYVYNWDTGLLNETNLLAHQNREQGFIEVVFSCMELEH